jgi:DEAD/DEAH box helicase domain-containing protein
MDGAPEREIFFDLETQYLAGEVPGGWRNIGGLRLALAVTYDEPNGYRVWQEAQAVALADELCAHDRVIGFNLLRFDYAVLAAYAPDLPGKLAAKTVDLHAYVAERLGFRVSLEQAARATLGRAKTGDGLQAVAWFRAGEIERVAAYCRTDVELTRDLYRHGRRYGEIFIPDGGRRRAALKRLKVDWGRDQPAVQGLLL